MASREAFLPVPTDDPEAVSYPTVPTYSPGRSGSVGGNSTVVSHLNVEGVGSDNDFPNSGDHHMYCFNRCCDFRRAVLIVNGISILIKLITMLVAVIGVDMIKGNVEEIERDMDIDSAEQLDVFVKGGGLEIFEALVEIVSSISIGLHACGVYGALNFKKWGILTAGSTYALALLAAVLLVSIPDIIFAGLCLYPHIYMYKLMEAGIMTEINYHKVANCCGDRTL